MGRGARAAGGRGPPGRRRYGQGAPARRRGARGRGADRVLVLDRELAAPAGRGRGADGHVRRADRRARHQSSTPRACGCASSGAARGSPPIWSSGWSGPSRRPRPTTRITLFVAFNYGGRAEIVDAARNFEGGSEDEFRAHLYAPEMHDPDLLIRTSGEQRVSNFLLWQCAYSELVFSRAAVARLRPRGVRDRAGRVREPPAPVRRALGDGGIASIRFRGRLRSPAARPAGAAAAAGRRAGPPDRRAPAAQAAPPALRDARPDRLGAPVDRNRGHDRDHRRRAVRSGDDRLRLRRHPRVLPDDP